MAGNLPVTTATFESELQSKINTVGSSTSIKDIISYYRAGENIPTINNTALTDEIQLRLNAVSPSTTAEEFLALAASFGKISNTNQDDLQSALLAIADIPTNSELATALSLIATSTGDIVETTRTVTEDGKNLLPIDMQPRAMTAAEKTDNPILQALLPTHPVETVAGITAPRALNINGSLLACSDDGSILYYTDSTAGRQLHKKVVGSYPVLIAEVAAGIDHFACSSDGQSFILTGKQSSTAIRILASKDGGATIDTLLAENVGSANPLNVFMSRDGKSAGALYKTDSATMVYSYWADLNVSTTPVIIDLTTLITTQTPFTSMDVTLGYRTGYATDDCTTLVITPDSSTDDRTGHFYLTDILGSPTLTTINSPVQNTVPSDGTNLGRFKSFLIMDSEDPDILVEYPLSQDFDTPRFTLDGGATWKLLPLVQEQAYSTSGVLGESGYSSYSVGVMTPHLTDGILVCGIQQGHHVAIVNLHTGVATKDYTNHWRYKRSTIKWNLTKTAFGKVDLIDSGEYPCLGAVFTIDTVLPAKQDTYRPYKIVGDTQ